MGGGKRKPSRLTPVSPTLYKILVRSRIDYGLIIYVSASRSNKEKIDVVSRSILRIILGSRSLALNSDQTPIY
ncbi:hypothetical protein OUZ56_033904 [Daphnia magna]|uniref:Uncharacterized protein n=1 Tax=Daphnia magna TaxID=35525 RepID=A0ABR0BB77_9CRUS|nr:hypothetical protein OUZ56_033904 [Daphnia magna]